MRGDTAMTPDQRAAMRARHILTRISPNSDPMCESCCSRWPCDTIQLLDALDARETRCDELRLDFSAQAELVAAIQREKDECHLADQEERKRAEQAEALAKYYSQQWADTGKELARVQAELDNIRNFLTDGNAGLWKEALKRG